MSVRLRCIFSAFAALFLIFAVPYGHSQNGTTGPTAPKYTRPSPVNIQTVQPYYPNMILNANGKPSGGGSSAASPSVSPTAGGPSGTLPGLDTVPLFSGAFAVQNGGNVGDVYPYLMVGKDPLAGGTTNIPVQITEVSLQLLKDDGTTFADVSYAPFDDLTTDSPNFANARYASAPTPTQFADAVQRAEFFNTMAETWHTDLSPVTVVNHITLTVPKNVSVQFPDKTVHVVPAYFSGTAPDGSTYVLMLDSLFFQLYVNAVLNDIGANNFTTGTINIDMFPNTYLYSVNYSNPNTPGSCCVVGFHTDFYVPGITPQPRWITIFASFISPGLFHGGVADVTGLSHEISESFNDPYNNNQTPSWQFPNLPSACQGNLETGDPVEVLPTTTVPLPVRDRNTVYTFHPQTEALLQWFEMGTKSNAVDGAFSFPDETALTQSATPCP